MQLGTLTWVMIERTFRSALRGMAPALAVVLMAILVRGNLAKAFILIAVMATLLTYSLVPMVISSGRKDGLLVFLGGLPLPRRVFACAVLLTASVTCGIFAAVAVLSLLPATAAAGFVLGPKVAAIILYTLAVSGLMTSILLAPLYARFPPYVSVAIPIYVIVVAWLLSRRLELGTRAEELLQGLSTVNPSDPRVIALVVSAWVLMGTAGATIMRLGGAAFQRLGDPQVDVDRLFRELDSATTTDCPVRPIRPERPL